MPVDPHIAAVLAALGELNAPPMHEGTPEAARASYRQMTAGTRSTEQVVPVAATEDRTVPGAAGDLPARVYRPQGQEPVPVIAFFHGGGWVIGDLDTHDNMARNLCRATGAVVVSAAYRLAPEHPFPAAADDAVAVARHLAAHPGEVGGDGRLAVAGDSAGGNLAAIAAQALTADGAPLAGQLLIYPAVDARGGYPSRAENAKGYLLGQDEISWFLGHYAGPVFDAGDPLLSPLYGELADLPPAVIVTAEFDPLRDEGEAYGKAMQGSGVAADILRYPGMIHGFFDMGGISPAAQAAVEESCELFRALIAEAPAVQAPAGG